MWTTADWNGYIDNAIRGLYPTFFAEEFDTTTAGAGPGQTPPTLAQGHRLHHVGLQRSGASRIRQMRLWVQGSTSVMVPKLSISGMTLTWAWTHGWEAPASDMDPLTIPTHSEEVVILRSHVAAIEHLLSSRVKLDKYQALNVRQSVTEADLATTLDALHASLRDRLENALPLPEIAR